MVGASATDLMEAILNRKPGQTVIYSDTSAGGYWITTIGVSTNLPFPYRDRPMYPWERRLVRLEELVRETIALFGRFNTGWIPSKGYSGPITAPESPETTNAPAPVDRRRDIRVITTVRAVRVP